jgi:phosphatidylglycerol:prolipoprotein diacylglycerol transferase
VHPLLFHFGNLAIPTYGVFTALALLAGLAMSLVLARRAGLGADKIWILGLVAILSALFGARLLLIAAHFSMFRAHPFWLLGLASLQGTWIALGGVAVGVGAGVLYALAEGLPLLATADAIAPGIALTFAIQQIGAFCGGLAWGEPTARPWGVIYRSAVAYVWYGTPLGVTLHPVQLYDAAVSLVLFGLLVAFPRQRAGEAAGAWLFLYGLCRFFVEFFRSDATLVFGGVFTLAQLLSLLAVLAGGTLWLRREPGDARIMTAHS